MTREEAIKILKAIRVYECYPKSASEETKEAIEMAIEALKENNQSDSLFRDDAENCKESESKLDLISREDAIDAVFDTEPFVMMDGKHLNRSTVFQKTSDVIDALSALPSAEARPTGEWIDIDNYYSMATCSHCHKVTMFEKWGEYIRPYNFCPNCGARMNGGEEE